jgi:hypothetical protein
MVTNTNRSFGNLAGLDQEVLQAMSKAFAGINGSFRFVFGFLYDKFSFRSLFLIILTIQVFIIIIH